MVGESEEVSAQFSVSPDSVRQVRCVSNDYRRGVARVLPEGWSVLDLNDCALYIGAGKSNTKESSGDYPLFGSTGRIGSCSNPEYEGQALLVARVGANAGSLYAVDGKYGVSDNTLIIRLRRGFVFGYFEYQLIRCNLNSLVFGSGQPLITGYQLKGLSFPIPPVEEQYAISNALSDVDSLINSLENLIAKKQAIKTATMQQLLTGRTRLSQFATHPDGRPKEFKQTELGVIPEDWQVCNLGQFQPFITSGSRGWAAYYAEFGDFFVRITNLTRKTIYLDFTSQKYVRLPEIDAESRRTQLCEGDLLISITADIGIVGYVDEKVPSPAYINQHIALVRFSSDQICSKFLAYFLASECVQSLFTGGADQGAKAGMNLKAVSAVKFVRPSAAEQIAIATILSDLDSELEVFEKRISKARQIKQGMMQELLTGRTRLV